MRPLVFAAIGLSLVPVATGCNLFGPKASDKIQNRPAPAVAAGRKPEASELIAYLNKQAGLMSSIESRDLTIDVKSPAGNPPTLDGTLVCQKPRSLKMVGKVMNMQQVVVGSNDERFWFWVKRDPSDALFHCSYSDYEKGVDLPFPFQPEWVVDALGMAPVGQGAGARVEEDKDTYRLIEDTTVQGQKAKKVTVFYKGMAYGTQPQVVSRTVFDASDRVIFVATTHKVNRVPVDRGAGAAATTVICPEVIKLEWPEQKTSLVLDLGDRAKVNAAVPPEAFQMPRLGSKQIDLGRDRPTGRGAMPTRYR